MNKIKEMNKIILKHGIGNNKYYRIVKEVEEYIIPNCSATRKIYSIKVQMKIFELGFSLYVTIKEWRCNYLDTKERDFIINEAEELFDKIVNPYKV